MHFFIVQEMGGINLKLPILERRSTVLLLLLLLRCHAQGTPRWILKRGGFRIFYLFDFFKLHDWLRNSYYLEWLIANWWTFPSSGVNMDRVSFRFQYIYIENKIICEIRLLVCFE